MLLAHSQLSTLNSQPVVKRLGLTDYDAAYEAMRHFTGARAASTPDELWLTEHPPVYTLGIAGRPQHLPRADAALAAAIPVKRVDRGGQITYHGPGQVIAYVLLDLNRRGLKVRELVTKLEQAVIEVLDAYNVRASSKAGAPGVYVEGAKIAALGLRVRRGCCYHGIALNVDMDLAPFHAIDPCGYPGLLVTQTSALGIAEGVEAMSERLGRAILAQLDH